MMVGWMVKLQQWKRMLVSLEHLAKTNVTEMFNLPGQITQKGLQKGSKGSPVPMTWAELSHNVASQKLVQTWSGLGVMIVVPLGIKWVYTTRSYFCHFIVVVYTLCTYSSLSIVFLCFAPKNVTCNWFQFKKKRIWIVSPNFYFTTLYWYSSFKVQICMTNVGKMLKTVSLLRVIPSPPDHHPQNSQRFFYR